LLKPKASVVRFVPTLSNSLPSYQKRIENSLMSCDRANKTHGKIPNAWSECVWRGTWFLHLENESDRSASCLGKASPRTRFNQHTLRIPLI
jgi:hypothetical protein